MHKQREVSVDGCPDEDPYIIKAGNSLASLWLRTRGMKKGHDLPTEHVMGQVRSPSSEAWLPLFHCVFCCLQSWTAGHCPRFISVSSCAGWALPGSARCAGQCCGGALAGAGSIPQPEPTPWGSLRDSNRSCPSTEHLRVPALATYASLHPAAGTIMMPFCRWGGVGGVGKTLAQGSPGSRAGTGGQDCIPSSRRAQEFAGTRARNKCTVRVQETTPRGPQAWQSPKFSVPISRPPPTQGPQEGCNSGAQGTRACPSSPALRPRAPPVGGVAPLASPLQTLGSRPD